MTRHKFYFVSIVERIFMSNVVILLSFSFTTTPLFPSFYSYFHSSVLKEDIYEHIFFVSYRLIYL